MDGRPWAFRTVADRAKAVAVEMFDEEMLQEAAEMLRLYSGHIRHITEFCTKGGRCLLRLPPVERREVDIDCLQPARFSVDRDKREAAG